MPSIKIKNFKFGLDTRKSELESQAGTLVELNNAHVNQGGEIEKRYGFFLYPLPESTFGAQPTAAGIVTFGSRAAMVATQDVTFGNLGTGVYQYKVTLVTANGEFHNSLGAASFTATGSKQADLTGVPTGPADVTSRKIYRTTAGGSDYKLVGTIADNVTTTFDDNVDDASLGATLDTNGFDTLYQRLQHPDGSTAMARIVHSEIFAGNAFAVAMFADGRVFAYYDGALVKDFTNGRRLPHLSTNALLASHIESIIDDTDFYEGSMVDPTTVQIEGPIGVDFTIVEDDTSVNGNVSTPALQQEEIPFSQGVSAAASFRIIAGTEGAAATAATGTITRDGTNPLNGDYIVIGSKRYTFKTTVTVEGDVDIGATAADTLANLRSAINHSGTPGTDYKCFAPHPYVTAGTIAGNDLPLTSTKGSNGNSVALIESITPAWTISGADFTGGAGNCVASIKVVSPLQVQTELLSDAVAFDDTPAITAIAVVANINAGTGSHGYTAESDGNLVKLFSSVTASPMPNEYVVQVTAGGDVCISSCMFYFVQLSAAGFTITSIKINGIQVLGSTAFPQTGTIDNFAELYAYIATQINAESGSHGIVAKASADFIQVSRLVTRSDDLPLPVTVAFAASNTGAVVFDEPPTAPTPLKVVVNPANVYDVVVTGNLTDGSETTSSNYLVGTTVVVADVTGGIAPYTFLWEAEVPGSTQGAGLGGTGTQDSVGPANSSWRMGVVNPANRSTLFAIEGPTAQGLRQGNYTARWVLRVTDSAGTVFVTDTIFVNFFVDNTGVAQPP